MTHSVYYECCKKTCQPPFAEDIIRFPLRFHLFFCHIYERTVSSNEASTFQEIKIPETKVLLAADNVKTVS